MWLTDHCAWECTGPLRPTWQCCEAEISAAGCKAFYPERMPRQAITTEQCKLIWDFKSLGRAIGWYQLKRIVLSGHNQRHQLCWGHALTCSEFVVFWAAGPGLYPLVTVTVLEPA